MRGARIDDILSGFDLSDIFDRFIGVEGAEHQLPDFDHGAFNDIAEALLENDPARVLKYRAVDMLHQLAVIARTEDPEVVVSDQLPFNTDAEFIDVWLVVLPDRSLRMPEGRRLSRAIVGHFTEIYPDATLSPCGTELRRGGTVTRLLDVLGLIAYDHPPLPRGFICLYKYPNYRKPIRCSAETAIRTTTYLSTKVVRGLLTYPVDSALSSLRTTDKLRCSTVNIYREFQRPMNI